MKILGPEDDPIRKSVAEAVRAQKVRDRERTDRALRPPASHGCVVCGGKLEPVVGRDQFTMHTVIGAPVRQWLSGYSCPKCHLMYSAAAAMPDEDED